ARGVIEPEGAIRAAVYGVPDIVLPGTDTGESLLVEEAVDALQRYLNPGSADADNDLTADEWAAGRSVADIRGALFAAADTEVRR
ncbi:hypothetical protein ACIQVR_41140, partial [Streptomyces xanthochromogenes]|uniref:hypothetical protein n=1 Tax=Streptomyces xanthochromogenes TaxID=67384 RepID=UPI0037F25538